MTIQIFTSTQTKKMSVEAGMVVLVSTMFACSSSMLCCDLLCSERGVEKENEEYMSEISTPIPPEVTREEEVPQESENVQPSFTFPPAPEPPSPPPLPPRDVVQVPPPLPPRDVIQVPPPLPPRDVVQVPPPLVFSQATRHLSYL